jgi:hypothetical protein
VQRQVERQDIGIAIGRIAAVGKPAPRPITMNASTGWRATAWSRAGIKPMAVSSERCESSWCLLS